MPDPSFVSPEEIPSIMTADFAKGEQFWKFWVSPKIDSADGDVLRIKVLSKKEKGGRFYFIAFTETGDGTKVIWAEGSWETDAELVAFVKGIQAVGTHMTGCMVELDMLDFTTCDSWSKWNYKFREGTTSKLWESDDGHSLRGNM